MTGVCQFDFNADWVPAFHSNSAVPLRRNGYRIAGRGSDKSFC